MKSDITIEVSRNPGSHPLRGALDMQFQHMYASSAFFEAFNRFPPDAQIYIARRDDQILAGLLFREDNGTVVVLNEQICMQEVEIERFVRYVFQQYPSMESVTFPAVSPKNGTIPYPHTAVLCTQDIVLQLPSSEQEYSAALGRATRSALKRYTNKIKRDFPSFRFEVVRPDQANGHGSVAADIDTLLKLSRSRIEMRNQHFSIDEQEAGGICRLCEQCGFLGLVKIDNEIVAGTINYRFGDNFFLHVVAHDSRFDQYGIGTICCYLSICESIAMGGKEYHFLWGRYEYKYRLLGVQRDFLRLTVYRSRLKKMIRSHLSTKPAIANMDYLLKDRAIHTLRRQGGATFGERMLYRLLRVAKHAKRAAAALRGHDASTADAHR